MADNNDDEMPTRLPAMYRRQEEILDGSPVFRGKREEPVRPENPQKAKMRQKLARARKTGQILMVANFVVLLVVFAVFMPQDGSKTSDADFSLTALAELRESRVDATVRMAFKHEKTGHEGDLVELWLWLGDDKALPKADEVRPPSTALRLVDVLPGRSTEDRIWTESLPLPPGLNPEALRLNSLVIQDGRSYALQSRIKKVTP